MRKIFAIFLLLVLLAGCSVQESQQEQAAAVRIGLCLRGDLGSAAYQQALTPVLESKGWSVTVVDAGQDQSLQDRQIQELTEKGTSLLIIEPVMTDTVPEIAELLQQSSTPGIFIGRPPAVEVLSSWDRICYVGGSENPADAQVQLMLSQESSGDLNGDGIVSYGILAGEEGLLVTQDALRAYQSLIPDGLLLDSVFTPLTRESGKQNCQNLLSQFGPDLEVLFCHNDQLALGAAEALQANGRTVGTDLLLIGNGGTREAVEFVQQQRMTGTVLLSADTIANQVAAVADILIAGDAVASPYPVEWVLIDRRAAGALLK